MEHSSLYWDYVVLTVLPATLHLPATTTASYWFNQYLDWRPFYLLLHVRRGELTLEEARQRTFSIRVLKSYTSSYTKEVSAEEVVLHY